MCVRSNLPRDRKTQQWDSFDKRLIKKEIFAECLMDFCSVLNGICSTLNVITSIKKRLLSFLLHLPLLLPPSSVSFEAYKWWTEVKFMCQEHHARRRTKKSRGEESNYFPFDLLLIYILLCFTFYLFPFFAAGCTTMEQSIVAFPSFLKNYALLRISSEGLFFLLENRLAQVWVENFR